MAISLLLRFDLTYEGLKQEKILTFHQSEIGFDLTYEGLKHTSEQDQNGKWFSFDLTYEGLKRDLTN